MGRDLSLTDVPKPGRYEWSMTIATVGGTTQEHWGTTQVDSGATETMAEIMDSIRRMCAKKLGAPESHVHIAQFAFSS